MTEEQINAFMDTIDISIVNGRYIHVLRNIRDGVDHEVHEYITKGGDIGYQVIFYKEEDGQECICSRGYGVQSTERTYDWVVNINE
mgnify:CR=1 FL=1